MRPEQHDDGTTPPLDLDRIERRLNARSPAEAAARRAELDAWRVGRDALTLGEQHLADGDLQRAAEMLTIAARYDAPDAHTLLDTVHALAELARGSRITAIAATFPDDDTTLVQDRDARDLTTLHAMEVTSLLDQARRQAETTVADARDRARGIIADAEREAQKITAEAAAPDERAPGGLSGLWTRALDHTLVDSYLLAPPQVLQDTAALPVDGEHRPTALRMALDQFTQLRGSTIQGLLQAAARNSFATWRTETLQAPPIFFPASLPGCTGLSDLAGDTALLATCPAGRHARDRGTPDRDRTSATTQTVTIVKTLLDHWNRTGHPTHLLTAIDRLHHLAALDHPADHPIDPTTDTPEEQRLLLLP